MHTTECRKMHTTECRKMHTTECNKRSAAPPQLTLYGHPCKGKRQCFGRDIEPHPGNLLPGDLLKTAKTLKMLDVINNATSPDDLNSLPQDAEKQLRQLSVTLNEAANRLPQLTSTCTISDLSSPSPPSSPQSIAASQENTYGYKATDQGVVAGTGVVAECPFRKGDRIARYTGPIVFRIRSANGRYHVFSVSTTDSVPQVQFHKNDTYIAWSGIYLCHSGSPGIEVGRDGDRDIRFLNHAKNANVQVVSTCTNRVNIHECNTLLLTVVALKDIEPGDELVFDYDKSKPDSQIDFSLTTVDEPDPDKASKIHTSIVRICQESDPILRLLRTTLDRCTTPDRCTNQQVMIPASLDSAIEQIMALCEKITITNGYPARIDELMSELSTTQKKLLGLMFTDDQPDLARIDSLADSLAETDNRGNSGQLTLKSFQSLQKYLKESFFNGKQTWITTEELKQRLHRK